MDMLRSNGIHLHYRMDGPADAPALVLINSLGTDFRVWDRPVERLKDRFRTIRYDKRGHGLSEAPPAPYDIDEEVGDLTGLLDALGVRDCIICGLSVGGLIAQGFYARHPSRVKGLILSNTSDRIGTTERWDGMIAAVREQGLTRDIVDTILERWFPARYRAENEAEIAGWRAMVMRTPVEGYVGTCHMLRETDFAAASGEIAVPVLCLGGDEDGSTPPEVIEELAGRIPGADYRLIQGTGHLPGVVKPDDMARLITGFCETRGLISAD